MFFVVLWLASCLVFCLFLFFFPPETLWPGWPVTHYVGLSIIMLLLASQEYLFLKNNKQLPVKRQPALLILIRLNTCSIQYSGRAPNRGFPASAYLPRLPFISFWSAGTVPPSGPRQLPVDLENYAMPPGGTGPGHSLLSPPVASLWLK